jgi:hypothetical protein
MSLLRWSRHWERFPRPRVIVRPPSLDEEISFFPIHTSSKESWKSRSTNNRNLIRDAKKRREASPVAALLKKTRRCWEQFYSLHVLSSIKSSMGTTVMGIETKCRQPTVRDTDDHRKHASRPISPPHQARVEPAEFNGAPRSAALKSETLYRYRALRDAENLCLRVLSKKALEYDSVKSM